MYPTGIDCTLTIAAAPSRVFDAFFDAGMLARWWQVEQAIVAARELGPFAISWRPTAHADPVLGVLGGTFHGIVMEARPPFEAFVAECYWLPPEGHAIGPMALSITCTPENGKTVLRVQQSGFEEGRRWRRYYEIAGPGLRASLNELQRLLEAP